MKPNTPREHAMAFIAAYDRPEADAYERRVTRVARRWLALMNSSQPTQGVVNSILAELTDPEVEGYGCAWDDLRRRFVAWAEGEEWLGHGNR